MKLEDMLTTKQEINSDRYEIENNIIRGAKIAVIGHFGNIVSLVVYTDNCCIISDYNNTRNIGFIIKALVELFDLTLEDGYIFSHIKDIPCRIICDKNSKVVGFGHFMKDKFVFTEDLMKIDS